MVWCDECLTRCAVLALPEGIFCEYCGEPSGVRTARHALEETQEVLA